MTNILEFFLLQVGASHNSWGPHSRWQAICETWRWPWPKVNEICIPARQPGKAEFKQKNCCLLYFWSQGQSEQPPYCSGKIPRAACRANKGKSAVCFKLTVFLTQRYTHCIYINHTYNKDKLFSTTLSRAFGQINFWIFVVEDYSYNNITKIIY